MLHDFSPPCLYTTALLAKFPRNALKLGVRMAGKALEGGVVGAGSRTAKLQGGRTGVVLVACGSFNPITNMHLRLFGGLPLFSPVLVVWTMAVGL